MTRRILIWWFSCFELLFALAYGMNTVTSGAYLYLFSQHRLGMEQSFGAHIHWERFQSLDLPIFEVIFYYRYVHSRASAAKGKRAPNNFVIKH